MGRVSRDARLTFIELWTLADDEGRLRGNSRMLASLLFPYDDDAKDLIDGWLRELESEDCLTRYKIGGDSYIQISNWLIHQKIDKPSKSKIPAFDESSRILAKCRQRIKDQGPKDRRMIAASLTFKLRPLTLRLPSWRFRLTMAPSTAFIPARSRSGVRPTRMLTLLLN